jgi:HEAT repeat protein
MIDNQTKQAITDAMKSLSDNNSSIRIQAAKKLGTIGIAHPQIIERLQSVALNDVSPEVRNVANASLEKLQPTSVHEPIVTAYQEQSGLSQANERAIVELLQKQNEILENLRILVFNSTEALTNKEYRLRTRIVDIDISISSMVNLMLKWVIASIPAAIIIGFMFFFFSAILGGCFAALGK